jgi:hypothetical protein
MIADLLKEEHCPPKPLLVSVDKSGTYVEMTGWADTVGVLAAAGVAGSVTEGIVTALLAAD